MKTILIVAAHKPYRMPEDPCYLPLQVGAAGKPPLGFQRDCEGENISEKNPHYCELTGLYWAWKNTESDALGLCHYRRHFARRGAGDKFSRILSGREIGALLAKDDILLPKKRHYWIETTRQQYEHAHHAEDLQLTRQILSERCPQALDAWDSVMAKTSGHRFNMFIMKREYADAYCAWLFPILFELEERLDISAYSAYDARVFGFVGERLLDVWLTWKGFPCRDIPYVFLERQNWLKKGAAFLKRKFAGGRKEAAGG